MSASFGEMVKRARMERRIPLKRVADAIGFSIPYVSDIEHGYRNPPAPDRVRLWADVLGIGFEELTDLATLSRGSIDLEIKNVPATRQRVALALARTWEHLTPEEEQELLETLHRIEAKGAKGNEPG